MFPWFILELHTPVPAAMTPMQCRTRPAIADVKRRSALRAATGLERLRCDGIGFERSHQIAKID